MKKLSILFLANSFSDDTIAFMPQIAKDLGYDLDAYNLYIGGCTIERHIENITNNLKAYELRVFNKEKGIWEIVYDMSANDFIASQKWDYFITQQASHRSGVDQGLAEINKLMDLVRDLLVDKNTKCVWNMTWSYPDFSRLEVFGKDFNYDQNKMYEAIVNNVKKYIVGNNNFVKIIPNGTAVMNARKIYDDKIIHRDDLHLSWEYGRYLASLTALAVLLDNDLKDVKYFPEPLKVEDREALKKCALEAVKNPF